MHATDATTLEMVPIDSDLEDRIAFDRTDNTVYVEPTLHSNPRFLSWVDKNKRRGVSIAIQHRQRSEIAELRQSGMRATRSGEDMDKVDLAEDQQTRQRAWSLIDTGAQYFASDIHIQTFGTYTTIEFAVDGECCAYGQEGQAEGIALMRALWQGLAQTKDRSWNDLQHQNAQIPDTHLPENRGLESARIIRGPAYPVAQGGLMMTIRLQYRDSASRIKNTERPQLPPLRRPAVPVGRFDPIAHGFTPTQAAKLDLLLSSPYGVIALVGPTGSGKSTLAVELLKEKKRKRPGGRIVTIEDPVELPLEFALQLPVTDAKNDEERTEKYEILSHASLRMAPTTLFYGEIRSAGVGVAAVQGAHTGHPTLTTAHVSDPFMFVERMEMLDPNRLGRRVICDPEILRGMIAMRLLTLVCESCSIPFHEGKDCLSPRIVTALEKWGSTNRVRLRGKGCPHCNQSGTAGRQMVAEVVLSDDELMADFIEKGVSIARANYRAREDSDASMLETAISRVLHGLVDPRDVEEKVGIIRAPLATEGRSIRNATSAPAPALRMATASETRETQHVA